MKPKSIAIKYGIGIGIALILYFLILSLFGLHTKPYFSVLNIFIVGGGTYGAIKNYKEIKKDKFKYQKGFRTGLVTGFMATIVFTTFFGVYASNLDPDFVNEMLSDWATGYEVGVGTVMFIVALMGFATAMVMTLSFMQIFKRSWNTKKTNRDLAQ